MILLMRTILQYRALLIVVFAFASLLTGCHRDVPAIDPAKEKASDEPSQFLARLVSDIKADQLKTRLQKRFPKIKVGYSDGLRLGSGALCTMVQCTFDDSRQLDAESAAVLEELQTYLTEIAQACAAEISELVVEKSEAGQVTSFAFVYRSPTVAGRVKGELDKSKTTPIWGVYLNVYE